MSRRSGHRFADKDMRQRVNLDPHPGSSEPGWGLEPRCRHRQRSPAHGPSGGVTPALAVVCPGREGKLAVGTRESNGSKAEALVAGRGIELGDLTQRTLRRKNAGLHIRGGRQVIDVELDPADEEAPTG